MKSDYRKRPKATIEYAIDHKCSDGTQIIRGDKIHVTRMNGKDALTSASADQQTARKATITTSDCKKSQP